MMSRKRNGNFVFVGIVGAINNCCGSLRLWNRRDAGERIAVAPLRTRVLWKRLTSTVMAVAAGAVLSLCFADEEERGDCRNASVSCLLWVFFVKDEFRPLALRKRSRGTGAGGGQGWQFQGGVFKSG